MYSNSKGAPLSLALWLAHDEYDHNEDPNHISVTGLIKPVKQIILSARVPKAGDNPLAILPDVIDQAASRIGTAIHNAVEISWTQHYKKLLPLINIPNRVIERIKINPTHDELTDETIPVYLEQRLDKKVGGRTVSGKFDMVLEGAVRDIKTTKTFSFGNKGNDTKYRLQGSIYRWLNSDIITSDHMYIDFVFMDWMRSKTADPNYPQHPVVAHRLDLLSIEETDRYVKGRLRQIDLLADKPQDELPVCTPEDLWQTSATYKYYKDPNKRSRSTKNFDNSHEANMRLITDGSVGVVVEVKGKVKACAYCDAVSICEQAAGYIAEGTLTLN